jgi:hypothetical protein
MVGYQVALELVLSVIAVFVALVAVPAVAELRFVTCVVEDTVNGAVPVETVEVITFEAEIVVNAPVDGVVAPMVPLIVALVNETLPKEVTVFPKDTEVFPIVTELLANWLFAILPSVPPNVIFPLDVTFPVSVMPLTVPFPCTCVTVPFPKELVLISCTVFNIIYPVNSIMSPTFKELAKVTEFPLDASV